MTSKELSRKYWIIHEEENQFARTLAIYIRSKMPQPKWHLLIPFKFLYEFLSTRRLGDDLFRNAMFFKIMALKSAYRLYMDENAQSLRQEFSDKLQEKLETLNLNTSKAHEIYLELIDLFVDHYHRLMSAQGKTYKELLKNGYNGDASEYEAFLDRVGQLEEAIVTETLEIARPHMKDSSKLEQNLRIKQESLKEAREKEVRRVFYK